MLLSQHLGIDDSVFPKEFWDEISIFTRYVISVSGGVDSTVIVNEFQNQEIDYELFWNNTLRSLVTSRDILSKIFRYTNKQFTIVIPHHPQKLITAKTKATMKRIVAGKLKYNTKTIPCCYYLKIAPFYKWLKEHTDQETLIISGIAGYEGRRRQINLGKLRKQNTFIKHLKVPKRWFAYPLRDYTKNIQGRFLENYLNTTDYHDTVRSGCYTCPIVALFENAIEEDQARIDRSKKVYLPK